MIPSRKSVANALNHEAIISPVVADRL